MRTKEYITKKLIEDGLMSSVIKPYLDDDGLKAQIGETWFYFGGLEYEYTDPSTLPRSVIVDLIKDVLDDMSNDDIDRDEYLYYYYYLIEHI